MRHYNICVSLILLLLLASCVRSPTWRKAKAKEQLAEIVAAYPDLIKVKDSVRIDTVRTSYYIDKVLFDTLYMNKAYNAIDTVLAHDMDTVFVPLKARSAQLRKDIRIECTAENLITPIHIDTLGVIFKVAYKGNKQIVWAEISKDQINKVIHTTDIVPCPECPEITMWQLVKKYWPFFIFMLIPWLLILLLLSVWLFKKFAI